MLQLGEKFEVLAAPPGIELHLNPETRIIAYERSGLIFVFSFHPDHSYIDYPILVPWHGKYEIILDSDSRDFGGFDRQDHSIHHFTDENQCIHIYIPSRTMIVLRNADSKTTE